MGNRLTRIYTRTGDNGSTGLADGSRVGKDGLLIACMGDVDELNSAIGVLLCEALPDDITEVLLEVQHRLFDIGGELSMPEYHAIQAADTEQMEQHLDRWNAQLPALKDFILPGGGRASALCHLSRAVCRRAERKLVALARTHQVRDDILAYVNRLSDLLFVGARLIAQRQGVAETIWSARDKA